MQGEYLRKGIAMLKLSEIKEPKLEITFPDGQVKSFDPWELGEKIFKTQSDAANPMTDFDAVRLAMGLPTQAAVDAAPDPKPFTLSRHMTVEIQAAIAELTAECAAVKKLKSLSRN